MKNLVDISILITAKLMDQMEYYILTGTKFFLLWSHLKYFGVHKNNVIHFYFTGFFVCLFVVIFYLFGVCLGLFTFMGGGDSKRLRELFNRKCVLFDISKAFDSNIETMKLSSDVHVSDWALSWSIWICLDPDTGCRLL